MTAAQRDRDKSSSLNVIVVSRTFTCKFQSHMDSLARHVIVVNKSLRREYKQSLLLKLTEIIFTVTVFMKLYSVPRGISLPQGLKSTLWAALN